MRSRVSTVRSKEQGARGASPLLRPWVMLVQSGRKGVRVYCSREMERAAKTSRAPKTAPPTQARTLGGNKG